MPYINPSTYPSSFGRAVRLYYEERNISIENNTSAIYWELQGYNRVNDSTGYYYAGPFTVTINGTTVADNIYPSGSRIQLRNIETARNNYSAPNNGLVASGTITITHDNDGSKTVAMSFSCDYIYADNYDCSGAENITLTTIPRASTLTIPALSFGRDTGEVAMGWVLPINRYSPDFTHTVTAKMVDAPFSVQNLVVDETASTARLQLARTSAMATYIPDKMSAQVEFVIKTFSNGVEIGSKTQTVNVTIPADALPTVGSLTAAYHYTYTHNGTEYILNNVSTATLTISGAVGAFGSNIISYTVVGQGRTITIETGDDGSVVHPAAYPDVTVEFDNLPLTGSQQWYVTALDGRGKTSTRVYTTARTVTAYNPPTVSITAHRCNSDGTANDLGEYAQITLTGKFDTSLAGNYSTCVMYYYNDSTDQWVQVSNGGQHTTSPYAEESDVFPANSTKTYRLRGIIADAVVQPAADQPVAEMVLSTAEVLMDVRKDGIAFGGSATRSKAVEIKNWAFCANNHRQYPGLQLKSTDQSTIGGWVWLACALINGLYVGRRVAFSQYSYDSSTGEQTSQFESYYFPFVDADLASQQNYEILTEKTMTPITDTWNPTISWSDGSTLTTTSVACNFQKYGKLIHYYGYFRITDLGAAGNKNLRITLPHTVLGTANGVGTRLEAETPPAKGLLIRVAPNYLNVVYSPSGGWARPQMSTGWYSFDFWALEA